MIATRAVALCGGVGGAKLALGLSRRLGAGLEIIGNTGDDFEHLGLEISPDLDTILYSLAGLASSERGWGREDETWSFMETLGRLGGPDWFQLGDRDLALHVARTQALREGRSLTSFTAEMAARLGIESGILPMSDTPVRTVLETAAGMLPFQRYFVERRCEPEVRRILFAGADVAAPTPQVAAALSHSRLDAIVICPSNPFLSIDPILAVPGMRDLLARATVPVVAVSPLIAGRAVKGPTDKIMRELGREQTSASIIRHYGALVDGWVIDIADRDEAATAGCPVRAVPTLMKDEADRDRLAGEVLAFAAALADRRETGSHD